MKKKWWMLSLSAALSIGLLAGCGTAEEEETTGGGDTPTDTTDKEETTEAPAEKVTLVMGTSADYPPYESVDLETEEIIGFDIDIAKHITSELGYDLQIENIDFEGLIPAIQADRVDFVLSGMTPTEERKENVDFSDIYFTAVNLIVTTEDAGIASMEDLEGKKVGVQLGSIQEGEADKSSEELGFEVVKLNRIPEIVQELMTGRIDAIIMEDTVAAGYIEAQDLSSFELPVEDDTELGSAIAFPKGSELQEPFNEKLNEMIDSGLMDELIIKWFDDQEE